MTKMSLLGIFILAALGVLFAGIFIIGNQQRLFSKTYRLQSEFSTVSGLTTGAEVRIGGVRKGTVNEIRLPAQPDGKVIVSMSIDNSTSGLIRKDSIAAIETEGLLGNKFLAISFGSPTATGVKDWDTIASAPPLDVSDMLKKTNAILETTHSAIKHFDTSAEHIGVISARINRGEGTIGALLNDQKLYNEFTAISMEAHATLAQAKVGVTAFQENMQALKRSFFFRDYFKDRGYTEVSELMQWEIEKMPVAVPIKKFLFLAQDLFTKPNTSKLSGKKKLKEVGAYLELQPFGLVVVQAFSRQAGGHESNLTLTQAQAVVVRNYLAENYELDDTKLKTKGMGEGEVSEPGREHWVEISVFAPTEALTQTIAPNLGK